MLALSKTMQQKHSVHLIKFRKQKFINLKILHTNKSNVYYRKWFCEAKRKSTGMDKTFGTSLVCQIQLLKKHFVNFLTFHPYRSVWYIPNESKDYTILDTLGRKGKL